MANRAITKKISALPTYALNNNNGNLLYSEGGANYQFPLSNIALLSNLGSSEGSSRIGLEQGGTIQNAVLYVTPEMFGAVGDGVADDSTAIQTAYDTAASRAVLTATGAYAPQYVVLNKVYKITRTIQHDGSKVRVASLGGGCLYFDPTSQNFTNSQGIVVSTNNTLAAFIGNAGSLYSGVSFITTGNTLDLFYAVRGDTTSSNNGACLHNIQSCIFRGFNNIYTHGAGGWGWVWNTCQASNCQGWLYITTQSDTYERMSFYGCTWQSGGLAFYLNNSNGKVYWSDGSFDYCTGIATIVQGHLILSGHIENTGRTTSLITITGSNASVVISGVWAIVANTSTVWYLVQQYQDYQLKIDNLTIVHDGNNVSSALISDKKFAKGFIYFASDAAKLMGYFSCDAELLSTTTGYFDYSLSNSAVTTASISGNSLIYTGVGSSGTTSYLYIDIPIHNTRQFSVLLVASNTSSLGSIPFTKQILTDSKSVISTITDGTASFAASSSNVVGGLRTMEQIPPSAAFLRLIFNGFYLNSSSAFTISSLKVWKA